MPETNYLVHYGIKGMKWGKRRFQNEDGSLTPAGARRYNTDDGGGSSKDSGPQYRAVPSNQYKIGVSGRQGTSMADRRRRNSRSSRESNWIVKGENGEPVYTQRARFDSAKGQSSMASKRTSNVSKEPPKNAPGESGGRDAYQPKSTENKSEYKPYTNRDRLRDQINGQKYRRGTSPFTSMGVPAYDSRASAHERMDYYAQKNKQPYGTNDTASTARKRYEKQTGKNSWKNFDNISEKAQEQLFRNSDKSYNEKKEQEHPNSEWMWNPSKDIHSYDRPSTFQSNMMYLNYSNAKRGETNSASPSENNPARYGKNDTASTYRKEAAKASKSQKGSKSNSLSTRAKQTISQATQQASQSVQKASDWLKKLLGKKG